MLKFGENIILLHRLFDVAVWMKQSMAEWKTGEEGYERNLFQKGNETTALTYVSKTHYTAKLLISHDPLNQLYNKV